jgi:hypothetical protein
MKKIILPALLLMAATAFAHHGNSAYDETARVTIKGVVTEFVWTNPHCQLYLDVKDKNGNVVHWGVETNSPAILGRAGWTRRSFKVGDEVTIILCPAKNGAPVAEPAAAFISPEELATRPKPKVVDTTALPDELGPPRKKPSLAELRAGSQKPAASAGLTSRNWDAKPYTLPGLDLLDERRFANGMVYLRYHAPDCFNE